MRAATVQWTTAIATKPSSREAGPERDVQQSVTSPRCPECLPLRACGGRSRGAEVEPSGGDGEPAGRSQSESGDQSHDSSNERRRREADVRLGSRRARCPCRCSRAGRCGLHGALHGRWSKLKRSFKLRPPLQLERSFSARSAVGRRGSVGTTFPAQRRPCRTPTMARRRVRAGRPPERCLRAGLPASDRPGPGVGPSRSARTRRP